MGLGRAALLAFAATGLILFAATPASAQDAERLRLRTARVRLVGGRWEIDAAHSGIEPFDGKSIRVRKESAQPRLPDVEIRFAPPGVEAAPSPPITETDELVLGPGGPGGFAVVKRNRTLTLADGSTSATGSQTNDWLLVGFVFAPDLRATGSATPSAFRNEFTLAILETDVGVPPRWTLDQWTGALAHDLSTSADEVFTDMQRSQSSSAAIAPAPYKWMLAHVCVSMEQREIAMALPAPGAISAMRLLDEIVAAGDMRSPQHDSFRLARFMAGDESVLQTPMWSMWTREVREGDAMHVVEPGGEFWARAAMLSPSPKLRAEAFGVLRDLDMSAEVAGDLLDGVHWARVEVPDFIRARLDAGPTEDRTYFGAVVANWPWFLGAGLLYLYGFAMLVRTLVLRNWLLRARLTGAWTFAAGIALASFAIVVDPSMKAPGETLALVLATFGARAFTTGAPGFSAWSASRAFALAVLASIGAQWLPRPDLWNEACSLLTGLGVVLTTVTAYRIKGRSVSPVFALLYAGPVAILHAVSLTFGAATMTAAAPAFATALLLAASVGALWAVLEVLVAGAAPPSAAAG